MLRLCRDYSRVDVEKVTFYYNRKEWVWKFGGRKLR